MGFSESSCKNVHSFGFQRSFEVSFELRDLHISENDILFIFYKFKEILINKLSNEFGFLHFYHENTRPFLPVLQEFLISPNVFDLSVILPLFKIKLIVFSLLLQNLFGGKSSFLGFLLKLSLIDSSFFNSVLSVIRS